MLTLFRFPYSCGLVHVLPCALQVPLRFRTMVENFLHLRHREGPGLQSLSRHRDDPLQGRRLRRRARSRQRHWLHRHHSIPQHCCCSSSFLHPGIGIHVLLPDTLFPHRWYWGYLDPRICRCGLLYTGQSSSVPALHSGRSG